MMTKVIINGKPLNDNLVPAFNVMLNTVGYKTKYHLIGKYQDHNGNIVYEYDSRPQWSPVTNRYNPIQFIH